METNRIAGSHTVCHDLSPRRRCTIAHGSFSGARSRTFPRKRRGGNSEDRSATIEIGHRDQEQKRQLSSGRRDFSAAQVSLSQNRRLGVRDAVYHLLPLSFRRTYD
jgi:hypothetical protein